MLTEVLMGLEHEFEETLSAVNSLPNHESFRCHEVARLLRDSPRLSSYPIVVRDGVVRYHIDLLYEIHSERCGISLERVELPPVCDLEPLPGFRERIDHSWCESGDVVIDYHPQIIVTPNNILRKVLIVAPKSELAGKAEYIPIGKEYSFFGRKWIKIGDSFTKIQI